MTTDWTEEKYDAETRTEREGKMPLRRNSSQSRNTRQRNTNSVVATFDTHDQVESAIRKLEKGNFEMKHLSVVGKDYHTNEHVVGYYNTGDRMLYWGKLGAFWGGFWGLLLGSGFFWVPGIGPLLVGGPLVMWIVGALEEAVVLGGLSALGAALYSIGIPNDSVVQYESEVKTGKLLLVAHGTPDEVALAKDILEMAHANATIHAEPVTADA
ncbi:DUF1269 domain-containing protein [Anatilimnocola floriformis]|uniref:DUF1269 domain-containing protein n=1 Tax=Anatilimnocola floriformis TaxID=2948575 RepID=UPI0020C558FF|nr:DUF1269 domain-containing protein [Anatilimnocola floriformis]